jgi:hypothetical protein
VTPDDLAAIEKRARYGPANLASTDVPALIRAVRERDAEIRRLRLVANDARGVLDHSDGGHTAALAESLAAWERGEDVREEASK